jgi:hypothetical protein
LRASGASFPAYDNWSFGLTFGQRWVRLISRAGGSDFFSILAAHNPRILQLGMKFYF